MYDVGIVRGSYVQSFQVLDEIMQEKGSDTILSILELLLVIS